ncbi:hypothetical protein LCGC14_2803310 [marine sediment metagenome]|uniref:Periplasmic heavy metal sensor n=1 Tax=marine sediment metagenome TaxID=412755 RepID=A0A0F9BDG5_9ZZZZ
MGAEDNDKPKRGRGRGGADARQRGEGGPGAQRRGQGGPGMGAGFGMFERLGLTEKQRNKIASIREEAMRKMMADIKKVLTDKQREQLEKAQAGKGGPKDKRGAGGGDMYNKLDLSKKQSKAIAKIRKKVRARMQDAGTSEERRGMMQQMHEDIKDILTDEQAEKLAEFQKQRKGGQRQRGEGRGDREGRGKGGKGRKGRGQDAKDN